MSKTTDTELVALIRGGDKRAEEKLLLKYRPRILKAVRYTLGRARTNCEDLANEVSMAVLTNLRNGKFAEESSFGTYVYGITKNKIAVYLRARKPELGEIPENYPNGTPTRDEEMEREETAEALNRALERLKPKYKKVLYLHYYKGFSITETGQELNISPRRVRERKHYALKKLKIIFNKSSFFATNIDRE